MDRDLSQPVFGGCFDEMERSEPGGTIATGTCDVASSGRGRPEACAGSHDPFEEPHRPCTRRELPGTTSKGSSRRSGEALEGSGKRPQIEVCTPRTEET